MKIIITGEWAFDRIEVQVDAFVNVFVLYDERVDEVVNQLKQLLKITNPNAEIEIQWK